MAQQGRHFVNEADIGSGERTPGQQEVDKDVASLNGKQHDSAQSAGDGAGSSDKDRGASSAHADEPGRLLRSGDHVARIAAVHQPDETYEAQVYVRLTHEPQMAETYIPAGIYATEAAALAAAEERALRAFKENEF